MVKKAVSWTEQTVQVPPVCWLCRRALGRKVQRHHVIPKARKGRVTVPVHPICHRAIHAHASNAALARMGGSRDKLMHLEEISRFVRWVADKPSDFHAPTRRKRQS